MEVVVSMLILFRINRGVFKCITEITLISIGALLMIASQGYAECKAGLPIEGEFIIRHKRPSALRFFL